MGTSQAKQRFGDKLSLPSLPDVVLRVSAMIDNPGCGLHEMGELAAQDPALTARVLRMANSGLYGLSREVTSAEEAATILGARALRNVVMQVAIFESYDHLKRRTDFDLNEIWQHATLTAQLAQALAQACQSRTEFVPDDFYACGLLHDVGKVVMLDGLGEEYLDCVRLARRSGLALHVAEAEHLGYTHVDVGALLAEQWRLPHKVSSAIEFHHGPSEAIVSQPHVGLIAIADQLAYRAGSSTFESALKRLCALAERLLGISPTQFDAVVERARTACPDAFD